MLILDDKSLYIHKDAPARKVYGMDQKLFDLVRLASSPGPSSSNAIYRRIQRRVEFDKNYSLKKTEKLKDFKMNGFDEHLFFASQQNEGVLIKGAIEHYAKDAFFSEESRNSFLNYIKIHMGYLAYLGLLNDTSVSNRFLEEKVSIMEGSQQKEHIIKVRLDYRYEVNTSFYHYLLEFQKRKEQKLKEQFEFGKFDAYIYSLLHKNIGIIDMETIRQEKVKQAQEYSEKILYQIRLMAELGYIEENTPGTYKFAYGFERQLEKDNVFLNPVEKKVTEFIRRHGVFSQEKYRMELETEAESYASILKGRLDKLKTLGYVIKKNDKYSFTPGGENRLKAYYFETYEFTSFDRNILNNNIDGILDLEEIRVELEGRYDGESAAQSMERQQERLFIMECAGSVQRNADGIYSLTGKGAYILEEENRIHTEEKRQILQQTFKYSDEEEEFLALIRSIGGTVNPAEEIKSILASLDPEGIKEYEAYNMLMLGYKSLGTQDIDAGDENKLSVKLGYLSQNEDGTLSLTPKGKRLVNAVKGKEGDMQQKLLSNKKFRLLHDIDKNFNRIDPKIYLKTQKIIADKDLRRTVNLLRYKPEKLWLLGLLQKNEDGSFTVTDAYDDASNNYRQQKREEELQQFRLSNVHKFILKFCRDEQFRMDTYKEYISKKQIGKSLEREMAWKKSSLEKLVRVGYFEKMDESTYNLTDKGIQARKMILDNEKTKKKEKVIQEFLPGPGYKKLLEAAEDGVLDYSKIELRIQRYNQSIRDRELSIKRSMLQKLVAAGYLDPITAEVVEADNIRTVYETSLYKLTQKAVDFIGNGQDTDNTGSMDKVDIQQQVFQKQASCTLNEAVNIFDREENKTEIAEKPVMQKKADELKITKFDLDNIINLTVNGFLSKDTVDQSLKRNSVLKRIQTLIASGLLLEEENRWRLTDQLLDRAKVREVTNLKREKTHSPKLDIDCLTIEQKKTLTDIKDFLNLTGGQILKHIYEGNENLFRADIRYLLEKGIINKDRIYDIYVLTRKGTRLVSDLTGDHHIFGSKLDSRREEIKHDVIIYTAYKDMEKLLISEGKVITSVKTDRVLRSEDMKDQNRMSGEYPDLRIDYEDKTTGEKGFVNIEVDTGYSEKVIERKLKMPNLRWYTNSRRQQEKVLKKARYMSVKIINEEYWR